MKVVDLAREEGKNKGKYREKWGDNTKNTIAHMTEMSTKLLS